MLPLRCLRWSTLLVAALWAGPAAAHPFHVSIAEAAWNDDTKRLEVALRVHPNDLERALRRLSGRRVVLESSPQVDRWIQQYLGDTFQVQDDAGQRQQLVWIGWETSLKETWLYFEIPLVKGPDRQRFENRLFFELEEDQVNTINFRLQSLRISLRFSPERAVQVLDLNAKAKNP